MEKGKAGRAGTILAAPILAIAAGCAHEDPARRVEREFLREHSSCLALGHRVATPEHTDCVLALYGRRTTEWDRLRAVAAPPPRIEAERPPAD